MILTEEEAKTKWCPHVRAALSWCAWDRAHQHAPVESGMVAATVNRGAGTSDECRCIASACMMWKIVPRQTRLKGDKTYERVEKGTCGLIR